MLLYLSLVRYLSFIIFGLNDSSLILSKPKIPHNICFPFPWQFS